VRTGDQFKFMIFRDKLEFFDSVTGAAIMD